MKARIHSSNGKCQSLLRQMARQIFLFGGRESRGRKSRMASCLHLAWRMDRIVKFLIVWETEEDASITAPAWNKAEILTEA